MSEELLQTKSIKLGRYSSYVAFMIDYATSKDRVELNDRWLPI